MRPPQSSQSCSHRPTPSQMYVCVSESEQYLDPPCQISSCHSFVFAFRPWPPMLIPISLPFCVNPLGGLEMLPNTSSVAMYSLHSGKNDGTNDDGAMLVQRRCRMSYANPRAERSEIQVRAGTTCVVTLPTPYDISYSPLFFPYFSVTLPVYFSPSFVCGCQCRFVSSRRIQGSSLCFDQSPASHPSFFCTIKS
jgi:hypothetical protein